MTSLMEVTELPTDLAGRAAPILAELNLASFISAALETIPYILSENLPSAHLARRLHLVRPTPALAHVRWLRKLEQQAGNALVLDRRGLTARGGLLPDDHLFKSMARKGLIRDNHVVWAARYAPLTLPPSIAGRTSGSSSSSSSVAVNTALAPSASAPVLGARTQAAAAPPTEVVADSSLSLTPTVFNVYALSSAVCGHRGIVHGGLSSAIIDETFGYLLYLLYAAKTDAKAATAPAVGQASSGALPVSAEAASVAAAVREMTRLLSFHAMGHHHHQQQQQQPQERKQPSVWEALACIDLQSAMTAHLEVDFVRPLPSDSIVACVAQVERVEGRKVWLQAQLMSRPPSAAAGSDAADAAVVYAKGKALFITPRPKGSPAS